jgi:hypothetical protein
LTRASSTICGVLEIGLKWTMNENSSVMKWFPFVSRLLL